MKFGLYTQTRNVRFVSARQRVQRKVEALKRLLEPIKLPGRHDNLLLTFVEQPFDHFDVIQKGPDDDIFEIDVGYNTSGEYPPQEDASVVRLLEEKLCLIFKSDDGFASKRKELLGTVAAWANDSTKSSA